MFEEPVRVSIGPHKIEKFYTSLKIKGGVVGSLLGKRKHYNYYVH